MSKKAHCMASVQRSSLFLYDKTMILHIYISLLLFPWKVSVKTPSYWHPMGFAVLAAEGVMKILFLMSIHFV